LKNPIETRIAAAEVCLSLVTQRTGQVWFSVPLCRFLELIHATPPYKQSSDSVPRCTNKRTAAMFGFRFKSVSNLQVHVEVVPDSFYNTLILF
jgi:hypothetical protein